MKRLLALAGATLLAFLLIPAVPASALSQAGPACVRKDGIGYDVKVCADFVWRMQNDGTGVHVEAVRIAVMDGCGDLEETALSELRVATDAGDTHFIGNQGTCYPAISWDVELNGKDKGEALVALNGNANVSGASDFDFALRCWIRPQNPDSCEGFLT